jgi:hypothetical protein
MRFFNTLATLLTLSLAGSALAAPSPLKVVEKPSGEVSGKHIIKFKKGVATRSWINKLTKGSKAAKFDIINGIARTSHTVHPVLQLQ